MRLHSKVFLAPGVMIMGSTNFTHASQQNMELSVMIRGFTEEEWQSRIAWFDNLFDNSPEWDGGIGTRIPPTPQRPATQ